MAVASTEHDHAMIRLAGMRRTVDVVHEAGLKPATLIAWRTEYAGRAMRTALVRFHDRPEGSRPVPVLGEHVRTRGDDHVRGTGRTLAGLQRHNDRLAAGRPSLFVAPTRPLLEYSLRLARNHHLEHVASANLITVGAIVAGRRLHGASLRRSDLEFDHATWELLDRRSKDRLHELLASHPFQPEAATTQGDHR